MAIAKPIRILGLIVLAAWIFSLYQIYDSKNFFKSLVYPSQHDERDPNLDCTPAVLCY